MNHLKQSHEIKINDVNDVFWMVVQSLGWKTMNFSINPTSNKREQKIVHQTLSMLDLDCHCVKLTSS
jgi:hypothetical protein